MYYFALRLQVFRERNKAKGEEEQNEDEGMDDKQRSRGELLADTNTYKKEAFPKTVSCACDISDYTKLLLVSRRVM